MTTSITPAQQVLAAFLEKWAALPDYMRADHRFADLRDAANRLFALASQQERASNPWKQALDDELVSTEATSDDYPSPKAAIKAIIDWHVSVALDPAVSPAAQALVDRGQQEAAHGITAQEGNDES